MAGKLSNIKQALPPRVSLPRKAKSRAGVSRPPLDRAALRVFSIPELLEQILLFAASDEVPQVHQLQSSTSLSSTRATSIAWRLFSLQCVNKDFHSTINGSAKLKRLMHLLPYANEKLERLPPGTRELLPFHNPLFTILDKLKNNGPIRLLRWHQWQLQGRVWDWESLDVHKDTGARLFFIRVCGQYWTEESSCFDQTIADLPQGWKTPDASWRNIKICNAKDSLPLILRVRREDRPWDLNWDMGRIELSWYLRGDETLGYVFVLFLQLFQHIDAIRVAKGNMRTKLEEIKQEKAQMERKWQRELERPRKVRGNRGITSQRAIMSAQRKSWEESEKELAAELKKTTGEWWNWVWAVEKEQNAKKRQLHPKSGWRHGSEV
ncbi:hypothetical protein CB0940_09220 [Cercospora beticola]|uniref:Uncharacterized protein n=1 Tax=Cercospora beticola TaxID=122368 RepID=A0A2G5HHP5_CERBT|nr:hypothetical protein CB0940_09220 [Cercospora beticola]PIA92068.1 hypothetical protein CB0940_09220 [Cercospora beticola]WPB06476.1 hypothetical protein RHO25_011133 [Cercospora beticola]CAK1366381.1 unnamed protein product [Cercospora beticola]